MNDKELLELAAKAAGYEVFRFDQYGNAELLGTSLRWNPLTDDGDRYRLIKALCIAVNFKYKYAYFGGISIEWPSKAKDDAYAIMMVAAEIGRKMK